MTTFYLDFEGGSDAANGTSFANRWKTITAGATAARIAAGDVIRVMASRPMASLGSATWTNGSTGVTLAAAKTLTIWNGDAAWTGVEANVTTSTSTAAPHRKIGATRGTLTPAAGFTTGKLAYFTLPGTLDLSAYQQVSFWFTGRQGIIYTLKLCTDATGDAPQSTFTFTAGNTTNGWERVVINNLGSPSALGAAIASISLHADTDPVTTVISIQNLIACKAPDDSECLTHLSLIGKSTGGGSPNEPEFYPLNTIDGTAITLGGDYRVGLAAGSGYLTSRNYSGVSEAVATYAQNPTQMGGAQTLQDSGTIAGGQITLSGGWDRESMSAQTGESWLSANDSYNVFAINAGTTTGWTISNIALSHGGWAFGTSNTLTTAGVAGFDVSLIQAAGFGSATQWSGHYYTPLTFNCPYITHCGQAATLTATFGALRMNFTGVVGSFDTAASVFGVQTGQDGAILITGDMVRNSAYYGVYRTSTGRSAPIIFKGITFSEGTTSDVLVDNALPTLFDFRECAFLTAAPSITTTYPPLEVPVTNYAGDPTDHRIYRAYGQTRSETSVRHTASGLAWKLSPTNAAYYVLYPLKIALGTYAFNASAQVTMKCFCRRDNTGLTVGIKVLGGLIDGVSADVSAEMTAGANTWEELTITFTPTQAGVLELIGYCHGGTTYNAYFDDVTVTQA